jgi:hypothetical protein
VGSFNQVQQSPHRRSEQFHQFVLPLRHHLSNMNVNTKGEETEEDNNNDLTIFIVCVRVGKCLRTSRPRTI